MQIHVRFFSSELWKARGSILQGGIDRRLLSFIIENGKSKTPKCGILFAECR